MSNFAAFLIFVFLIPIFHITCGQTDDKLFLDDNPKLPYSECRKEQVNVFCLGGKGDKINLCIDDRDCDALIIAVRRESGILWVMYVAALPQIDDALPNRVYFLMMNLTRARDESRRNITSFHSVKTTVPYRLHNNMVAIAGAGSNLDDMSGHHAILVSDPTAQDGARAIPGGGPNMFAKNVSGSFYPVEDPARKWHYFAFTSGDVISYPSVDYSINLLSDKTVGVLIVEQEFDRSIKAYYPWSYRRIFAARTFLPMERLPYEKCAATRPDFFCIGAKGNATAFPEGSGCLVTRDCDAIFYAEQNDQKTVWNFLVASPEEKWKRKAAFFLLSPKKLPAVQLTRSPFRFDHEQIALYSQDEPRVIYGTNEYPDDFMIWSGAAVKPSGHDFIPANGDSHVTWRHHNFTTPPGMAFRMRRGRIKPTLNLTRKLWPLFVIDEDYWCGSHCWWERKMTVYQSPRAIRIFDADRPPVTTTQAPITETTTEDPDEEETTTTLSTTVANETDSTTTEPSTSPTSTASGKSTTDGGQGSQVGKWIGITLVILAVLLLAGAMAYFVLKPKQNKTGAKASNNATGSVAMASYSPSTMVVQPYNIPVQEPSLRYYNSQPFATIPEPEVTALEVTRPRSDIDL